MDPAPFTVAALQVAFVDGEPPGARWARIAALVRAHRDHDLVVLPELWAHGAFSPARWDETAEALSGPLVEQLAGLARETGVTLHAGSIVERAPERGPDGRDMWNTSVVFGPDGGLNAVYRKIHRFGFGEGEAVLLEAGDEPTTFPLGPFRVGMATCYDLRFPELFRALVDDGADLFVVPASWPAARREHWTLLGRARAVENQAYVVQVNATGRHGGLAMGGHSQIVAPTGEVLASAGDDETALTVELDPTCPRAFRADFPVLVDRRLAGPR